MRNETDNEEDVVERNFNYLFILIMKKYFLSLLTILFFMSPNYSVFADSYFLYYWQGCHHCANVEKYFQQENITKKYNVNLKEVYFNSKNRESFMNDSNKLNIPESERWVPTLIVFDNNNQPTSYKTWDEPIISLFKSISKADKSQNHDITTWDKIVSKSPKTFWDHLSFFSILLPAAISDSINPCEFAVMLILLWAILIKYENRRKVILAWCLFSLAVFLSYYAMWIGLYSALSSFSNVFYLKIWIWILGIIVWLANFKDYFWYGKWFVMEVPFSWRKNMKKILTWITSPFWAFGVWIIVSLFLLPCTSWPYLVILGYLSSQNANIDNWGYIYLFIYNLFFILPMLLITIIVGLWKKSTQQLEQYRDNNIEKIHLIVGILMMLLWIYVILQAYSILP